ncbi:GAP family protein [Mycobacterium sp. 21AC1]|uniref:GAP family protein n=1 Tax=[Mycobacterium] appelbergii TaxID=2939269 RepID=UPI002939502C|nr:GAP family protein [Mycobacterium sp. 21AC1]MDV3124887.1 GAP family protein [Mycobacterium sp. 21AC1]
MGLPAMWSTVLVLAVVAAADPLRIGVVAYMLSRPRPMRLLLPFFAVGFAANIAVGAAVVFVFKEADGGRTMPPLAEIAIGLVAGLIALLAATGLLERLFNRIRGRRAVVAVGTGTTTTPAPPTLDSLPVISKLPNGIKAALRGESAWAAALLGLSNGFPTPYYLAAMAAALTSGAAVGEKMAALVAFNVVAFAAALLPILSFWIAPEATRSGVERIYAAMKSHQRLVIAVIAGAVGVFFVGLGISHL